MSKPLVWAIAAVVAFVFYLVIDRCHRRLRRRHRDLLPIDSLFDAVAQGHLTAEEASQEIVRRHNERNRILP